MGNRVIGNIGDEGLHQLILMGRSPRAEDFSFCFIELSENAADVFVRFSLTIDDFGEAGPFLPVRIQLGKAHFLIVPVRRILPEQRFRRFDIHGAIPDSG